jgi:hypothetical protein
MPVGLRRYNSLSLSYITKKFGPASDPSSLGLMQREFPSNETVEVRNTPVEVEVG